MAIALIFFQEYLRLSQAKPIDALLDISNGEKVFPFTGNGVKNTVLHLVGVLVFIHHDLHIFPGNLLRQLRRRSRRVCQQFHGVMLLVGKIRHIPPHLFLLKALGKVRRQVHQGQHGRSHGPQVLQMLCLGHGKGLHDLLQFLLESFLQLLHPGFPVLILLAPNGLQPGKRQVHRCHGVPAPVRSLPQCFHRPGHSQKARPVGCFHRRTGGHFLHRPLQSSVPEVRPLLQIVQQNLAERRLLQMLRHRLPELPCLPKPCKRMCLAL